MSQNVNVNLVPGNYPKEFHVSQYDVGRQLVANIVDSTGAYSIPSGATVTLVGTKPSGFGFTLNGSVGSGGVVTFSTTATVTAEYGRIPCEIRIESGNAVLGTANLMLIVEESPHQDGVIDGNSETVIPELTILVERVEAAASNVLDMQVEADTLPAGSSATYSYDEETNTATFGIPQGEAGAGAAGVVAPAYSASSTYAVGDYVIHDGNLYRCTTAIATAEAFTAAHWTQVVLGDDVSDLKSDCKNIKVAKAFTADCFEKGSWSSGNKSQYRDGNRIRTKSFYYLLNDFFISSLSNSDGSQYLITYFTQSGTYGSQVGWQKYGAVIPKGSIIALSFTASNDDSAPQMSVNDVLALFSIVPDEKNVIDVFDASSSNVVKGIYSSAGAYLAWYSTRLLVMDYIKCDESFITVNTPSTYQYSVLGFNADFELIGYGLLGDWVSGEHIVDVSDYSYVSFILQKTNASNISLSEITNLSVTKNLPKSIEYFNNGNIRSFAKDGINDSNNLAYPRYPKSSLISFQKAYDQGFRSLLIHVQFTSDGVPVVYHDQYINRYARNIDGTAISGTVYIANSSADELDSYDFGIFFGQKYAGTKITRLSEALTFIKEHGMSLIIEPTLELTDAQETTVCDMLKAKGLKNVGYQGYSFNVLSRFHGKMPEADLLLWMDTEAQMLAWAQNYSSLKDRNNLYFYTYAETSITAASCLTFAQYGVDVIQQALNGIEPNNIRTGLASVPYTSAVVSQVIPAYSAEQ